MSTGTEEAGGSADVESCNLGQVVARLSGHLDAERSGAGTLAGLRRIGDHDELPAAFWHFYLRTVPEPWREPGGRVVERIDRAWAGIVRAMVEMAPRPHSFDRPLGRALAATDYSEDRFVRLLRARDGDLHRELRAAGAWLARAGVKANWEQPAHLVLGGISPRLDTRHPDGLRHQIARDYFRETSKRQSTNQ